jgi:hypothetical protein
MHAFQSRHSMCTWTSGANTDRIGDCSQCLLGLTVMGIGASKETFEADSVTGALQERKKPHLEFSQAQQPLV